MKGTLCLVLLATLCVFASAQSSCRFLNNTNPTTRCVVQSVSTSELKIKIRNQMVELNGTLNSLLRTAQSQPFYRTWFPNKVSILIIITLHLIYLGYLLFNEYLG